MHGSRLRNPAVRHQQPRADRWRPHRCGGSTRQLRAGRRELHQLRVPGALRTAAFDIDDRGRVVGFYMDGAGPGHGFLLEQGQFTTIDIPDESGARPTQVYDINNRGQMTSAFIDAQGVLKAFVRDKKGVVTEIAHPDATPPSGPRRQSELRRWGSTIEVRSSEHSGDSRETWDTHQKGHTHQKDTLREGTHSGTPTDFPKKPGHPSISEWRRSPTCTYICRKESGPFPIDSTCSADSWGKRCAGPLPSVSQRLIERQDLNEMAYVRSPREARGGPLGCRSRLAAPERQPDF